MNTLNTYLIVPLQVGVEGSVLLYEANHTHNILYMIYKL